MSNTHSAASPWAARAEESRGRRFAEPEHPYRNCFERDRDRIIHSRAFRRLEYKTQVFPNYEGDHFRTRLTHTIEVAQIARTVARALGLNSTLTEAISLAHDLGHPPFGHAGEEALDAAMAAAGGFEHNRHALRIVEELEQRYATFRGLNLSYEVREGIVKHNTRYDRFRDDEIGEYAPDEQPLLEAQVIDFVDEIAYSVHDIDDGVEAHVLEVDRLVGELPGFASVYRQQEKAYPGASRRDRFNEAIRGLLDLLVTDLIDQTRRRIRDAGIDSVDAVRRHPEGLVAQGEDVRRELERIAVYLTANLYRAPRVAAAMDEAKTVVAALFEAYREDPARLPPRHRQRCESIGETLAIADYVAGMTDRFALQEYRRLGLGREFAGS